MSDYLQVSTTTHSEEDAGAIARSLVEQRLAACVQILGPISSTYWWEGRIESAQEWQCIAKTRSELYPELEEAIRRVHPYEVPEILALPLVAGNRNYLEWMDQELQGAHS